MTNLGITIPVDGPRPEDAAGLAQLRAAGYTEFWSAETARWDAFTPLAYAAALSPEATFGTAIASVFARGPALLAMNASALADMAPGRFLLGIGTSSALMTEDWNAAAFDRPLARVRDTVRFLRAALAGERVDEQYETFAVRGFRLERAPDRAPPILVAALRPGLIRVAAQEADGIVLNWLSAADVRTVLNEVDSLPEVAARIFVCPSTNPDIVRAGARRLISTYGSVPTYAAFHRWLGRGPALEQTWAAWAAGDRKGATAAVPDEVVDALVVHGSPAECAAHLADYVAAGVTRPVVKMLALDPERDVFADALAVGVALSDRPRGGTAATNRQAG
jgi:probable F420-dependent oxidoreductase